MYKTRFLSRVQYSDGPPTRPSRAFRNQPAPHDYSVSPLPEAQSQCMTTEQPPKNPCARCVKKGLACEYVASPEPEYYSADPRSPDISASVQLPTTLMERMSTPPVTSPKSSRGPSAAPPLPYTGPPPSNRRPRYAGAPLPNLVDSTASNGYINPQLLYSTPSAVDPRYYVSAQPPAAYAQEPQPYDLQAAKAQQYLAARAHSQSSQPYPADYNSGQHSGTTPQYGWTAQQGIELGLSDFPIERPRICVFGAQPNFGRHKGPQTARRSAHTDCMNTYRDPAQNPTTPNTSAVPSTMTAAFHLPLASTAVFVGEPHVPTASGLVLLTHSKKLLFAVAGNAALKGQPHVSLVNPAVLPTLAQQTVKAVALFTAQPAGYKNPPLMTGEKGPGRKSSASQPDGVGDAAEHEDDAVAMLRARVDRDGGKEDDQFPEPESDWGNKMLVSVGLASMSRWGQDSSRQLAKSNTDIKVRGWRVGEKATAKHGSWERSVRREYVPGSVA
ncbi:hypothetical protein DFH09DRAFT_1281527 [Mycena vulgaris]|nr:hypothetical protein DFH09DRAFT_1281527 [Mycena vulgaris]